MSNYELISVVLQAGQFGMLVSIALMFSGWVDGQNAKSGSEDGKAAKG